MLRLSTCFARGATLIMAVALMLCSNALLGAQGLTSTASLAGIVLDPQGNRVVGAAVTISNAEQGFSRQFKTDASGAYSFSLLPPAVYKLSVEASGFKVYVQDRITLEVGQAGALNVTLMIGSAATQVEVTSEAPLLSTDNANMSSEISEKQIVDLPLNLRNAVALTFLDSSVYNIDEGYLGAGVDTADEDISFMTFGGQFLGGTAYVLDGGWITGIGDDMIAYVPSVDDLQEFKVQTNSFTAQYGLSAGNVITLVTKSGTNQFHGEAYDFFRNSALDANYYFNNYHSIPKTLFHLNEFGVNEGGPLYIPGIYKHRDRTYFFLFYEGLRESTPSTISETTPTSAFKTGNLSALLGSQVGTDALGRPIYTGQIYNPFSTRQIGVDSKGNPIYIRDPISNNNLAGMIDPVAQKLLQYFPAATNTNQFNNFYVDQPVPLTNNEFSIRLDHNLTPNARIYGRYADKTHSTPSTGELYGTSDPGGPGEIGTDNRYNIALGYSQVFNPSLTGSVNVGFTRWVPYSTGQGYNFKPSAVGLPSALDSLTPMFPSINFSAETDPLISSLTSAYAPLGNSSQGGSENNIGTISVDLTKVHGSHTFSFGYMGILQQLNSYSVPQTKFSFTQAFTSGPNPNAATSGTGDAFASFLLGTALSGSTTNNVPHEMNKITNGWYAEDDWKLSTKLTLNLGVRYDIQNAVTEKRNRQAYFDPNMVNPISSAVHNNYNGAIVYNSSGNRGNYQTHHDNFAPRLGFAYQVLPKLVARGGFGVFFPPNFIGSTAAPGFVEGTSYISSLNGGLNPSSTLGNPFPQGILAAPGNSEGGLTDLGQSVPTMYVYKQKSFYVEQRSFGLQYSPTSRDVFEVTYEGNHVVHVPVGNDLNLNQLPPQDLTLGSGALVAPVANPFYGQASMAGSSCGLASSTVPAYQLMLPMPQYCDSVSSLSPQLGFSNYNEFETKYTHRAKNLMVMANYTWAKWIDNAQTDPAHNDIFYVSTTRNNYDLSAEKSVDEWDIPHGAVFSLVYNLPVGRGEKFASGINRATDAFIGGWEVSSITTMKGGVPISPQANVNPASLFGGNQHAVQVGDPKQPGNFSGNPGCTGPTKVGTVAAWYNPCAFVAAPAGTFGTIPRYLDHLRTPGYDFSDISIEKWFNFKESVKAQFRAEMFNAFNHPILGEPFSTVGASNAGSIAYADISRQIEFGLKIHW